MKTAFVYAVCGNNEHIETLNVSLQFFKKFSKSAIFVITDSSRNNIAIQHDKIIDIKTDIELDHHQASIFLKTTLPRYLDMEDAVYCYVDSDVLAISDDVDTIFAERFQTIGFCPDNISFDYFSPYAMNCECLDIFSSNKKRLENAINDYNIVHQKWENDCNNTEGIRLEKRINEIKTEKFKNLFSIIRYTIQKSTPYFKTVRIGKYSQRKTDKSWYNKKGEKVLYPIEKYENYISRITGFNFNSQNNYWTLPGSQYDVTKPRCVHLHDAISKEFSVNIHPENWQHPNGGVFLFNKFSIDFLERWHSLTLEIFAKSAWKTRDQGTLATAFWEFNLQQNDLISEKYNYIIDYFCDNIDYDKDLGFSKNNFKTSIHPKMVHVFHRFGDKNWDIWNYITSLIEKE